jgi:hypothetical protein
MRELPHGESECDKPPLFRKWSLAYLAVLVFLAILIVCFTFMSRILS